MTMARSRRRGNPPGSAGSMTMMRRAAFSRLALVSAAAAVALTLLTACQPQAPAFQNVDITGAPYARELALTDHTGARRTLADYKGKVLVVFFGFTQCPDVCPTTLADLAQVRHKLGPAGRDVQVIFVTVDPERDTQAVLAQYVPGFDPSFVGLYGSADEIARAAREFKVFYQKVAGKTPTSYTIDHTAGSYVFDREGRVRLFVKHAQGVDALVSDLKRLL
jgi:protein SCO1